MGRKSALSVKQWKDIETRFYAGESASALAREYGITEAAIRKRFGANRTNAKTLAVQLVAVESKINECDLSTKTLIRTYADKLLMIQNLAGDVATAGMRISKRISETVRARVDSMTDDQLMDDDAMRPIMAAGMVANTHAKLGVDLMSLYARKQKEAEDPDDIKPISITVQRRDARITQ